ncbi:MAG: HD domain-containing protein, partial [Acidobacteria bacterium]|nr:HD domain-containing protein [Acidobacteriota bacterium]
QGRRDVPDAGGESRPKPKYSELDLVRVELQSLREEEATPVFEPSNLYEESQQFVLESIRKADQEEGPDVQWGGKLVDRLITSLDTDLELLLKATERSQPFALSAHCVNVVIFALKMAKTLKCDQATQQRVGLAALLHEIGVIKLPKQLVYKQEMLNAAELEALRQRPVYSAEILQILGDDYAWLAEIVGQVYERENGSGFPLRLDGNAVLEEAKIIGVADIFEACIHERPYRKAMTGFEAVRQLTSEGAKLFSDRIVKALMNSFSLYPYNEYVKLNSGEIGQVVEVNPTNLFRPLVKILYDRQGDPIEEAKTVDLTQNASLFISKAITADELPQSS